MTHNPIVITFKYLLRGVSQVMLQRSWLAGLFFASAIAAGSYTAGTMIVFPAALAGLCIATAVASFFNRDFETIDDGLCGYNGLLIGCALGTFIGDTAFMWTSVVVLSAVSDAVRRMLGRMLGVCGLPSLTASFVLLTWVALIVWHLVSPSASAAATEEMLPSDVVGFVSTWLIGVSQVFLIDSPIAGLLMLAGLAVCSVRAAVWAALASASALFLAILTEGSPEYVCHGLFGFNPVLTAIALGSVFGDNTRIWTLLTIAAVVLTFFVELAMSAIMTPVGLPVLTAPFCIVVWMVLVADKAVRRFMIEKNT